MSQWQFWSLFAVMVIMLWRIERILGHAKAEAAWFKRLTQTLAEKMPIESIGGPDCEGCRETERRRQANPS